MPGAIAKPLVRSLVTEVVARDREIARWVPIPTHELLGFDDSVRLALENVREDDVETRWSTAARPGAPSDPAVAAAPR